MKKYFLLLITPLFFANNALAQSRGVKIGYIDMEYILEKVPSYAEANNQLELKAQKWKQEMEAKKSEIDKQKDALKTERVLLTKELIEEREQEIAFLETELLDYQQKKFGPNGELVSQKAVLVKPIQDQVFNAVQDLAEAKKYDYIFDKSSDLTMLFAAKRFDVSDRVITILSRAERKEQLTKKQIKEQDEQDKKQDLLNDPDLSERQKTAELRKAERQKMIDDRKAEADAKRAEADARRKQLLADKEAKKNGTVSDNGKPAGTNGTSTGTNSTVNSTDSDKEEKAAAAKAKREQDLAARQKVIEDRKKAAEEKRLKALADREAAKKAREEAIKNKP